MIPACKYTGSFNDHSGYGSANRADITALYCAGVNLTTELVVMVNEKSNYGLPEYICTILKNRNIEYKIKIIHLTPDCYPRYKEEGKYNIGRLMWETDRLPQEWIGPCNQMAEIWTASERMVEMIKRSGVNVPIYHFPEPSDTISGEERIAPFEMKYKKDFIFYSIFQWIDRKNPRGLLRAYWKAFEGKDDVTLLLKTYRVNYSLDEYQKLEWEIEKWRKELGLGHYPKIFLVERLLKDSEVPKLHILGDVYVNPSSGEGWCRPMAEAMLFGKPVISADNGGITDHLTDDYYFRVPSVPKQVTEVPWIPWYKSNMNWWEIREDELSKMMRTLYDNRNLMAPKAEKAKQWVVENCSYQAVGNQLKNRLEQIERIL